MIHSQFIVCYLDIDKSEFVVSGEVKHWNYFSGDNCQE